MSPFRFFAFVLFVSFVVPFVTSRAAEPFLKPNDVVALVGGEDMVAASEYGYLELLLQRALPHDKLKFRSLAWEGDTVFEQPRELNYPTLEAQLDEIGATVVVMQFGQMESLAGTSKLPEFIKAYEKMVERLSAGGKRRVVFVEPPIVEKAVGTSDEFARTVRDLAVRLKIPSAAVSVINGGTDADGIHLPASGLLREAAELSIVLATSRAALTAAAAPKSDEGDMGRLIAVSESGVIQSLEHEKLRQLIAAKNLLWFHYYRPQNWAFLNGDRTEQPSSRDHKDPSKRWFPEEMKQFLSLVEAKEKEIWDLAAKSAQKPAQE